MCNPVKNAVERVYHVGISTIHLLCCGGSLPFRIRILLLCVSLVQESLLAFSKGLVVLSLYGVKFLGYDLSCQTRRLLCSVFQLLLLFLNTPHEVCNGNQLLLKGIILRRLVAYNRDLLLTLGIKLYLVKSHV